MTATFPGRAKSCHTSRLGLQRNHFPKSNQPPPNFAFHRPQRLPGSLGHLSMAHPVADGPLDKLAFVRLQAGEPFACTCRLIRQLNRTVFGRTRRLPSELLGSGDFRPALSPPEAVNQLSPGNHGDKCRFRRDTTIKTAGLPPELDKHILDCLFGIRRVWS